MDRKQTEPIDITMKDALEVAWRYFERHAQQRVSYFNFYVVFSALLLTAYMGVVTSQNHAVVGVGVVLGCLQTFMAFIFWKIDSRNKVLTKNAEKAIIELEGLYPENVNDRMKLFTYERNQTRELISNSANNPVLRNYTIGQLFRIIFLCFMGIGLVQIAISVYLIA